MTPYDWRRVAHAVSLDQQSMPTIPITPTITVDESEIVERFIRASGPGGQNVNKVATAVQVRFDAAHSPSLPEPVRARLLALAGNRATSEGEIVITANRFRTQERNRFDALARLTEMIRRAAEPPAPRHATRIPTAQRRQRLEGKRHRSLTKSLRGSGSIEDGA
jgi:ribosome-associated protein